MAIIVDNQRYEKIIILSGLHDDYNKFYVNGSLVLTHDLQITDMPTSVDITDSLVEGRNVIVFENYNRKEGVRFTAHLITAGPGNTLRTAQYSNDDSRNHSLAHRGEWDITVKKA